VTEVHILNQTKQLESDLQDECSRHMGTQVP